LEFIYPNLNQRSHSNTRNRRMFHNCDYFYEYIRDKPHWIR